MSTAQLPAIVIGCDYALVLDVANGEQIDFTGWTVDADLFELTAKGVGPIVASNLMRWVDASVGVAAIEIGNAATSFLQAGPVGTRPVLITPLGVRIPAAILPLKVEQSGTVV